jgi:hypothetical protein
LKDWYNGAGATASTAWAYTVPCTPCAMLLPLNCRNRQFHTIHAAWSRPGRCSDIICILDTTQSQRGWFSL